MSALNYEAPLKVMIKDLLQFKKLENLWTFTFNGEAKNLLKLNKIHVQGEINKTAGFLKEIFIINDGTAKAKVTRGTQVPGDMSWINIGVYCSVIGHLVDNGKLPHIAAIKIAKVNNSVLQEMWPFEVLDLKNVLLDTISLKYSEDTSQ